MPMAINALALVVLLASPALAQGMGGSATQDRGYIGQMTEEQIRQKLAGEGFTEVGDLKKVPVTKYRWTGKAKKAGKQVEVAIDEFGHVSAK
jgi:hypothetical protein